MERKAYSGIQSGLKSLNDFIALCNADRNGTADIWSRDRRNVLEYFPEDVKEIVLNQIGSTSEIKNKFYFLDVAGKAKFDDLFENVENFSFSNSFISNKNVDEKNFIGDVFNFTKNDTFVSLISTLVDNGIKLDLVTFSPLGAFTLHKPNILASIDERNGIKQEEVKDFLFHTFTKRIKQLDTVVATNGMIFFGPNTLAANLNAFKIQVEYLLSLGYELIYDGYDGEIKPENKVFLFRKK